MLFIWDGDRSARVIKWGTLFATRPAIGNKMKVVNRARGDETGHVFKEAVLVDRAMRITITK